MRAAEIGQHGSQKTDRIGQIQVAGVGIDIQRRRRPENGSVKVEGYAHGQIEIAVRVAHYQMIGPDGRFRFHRAANADAVIEVAVVVCVRPPALFNSSAVNLGILPVSQMQDAARAVLGAQPRCAAVVTRNGLGSRIVRQGQRQGDVGAASGGQPVGDLLAIFQFQKGSRARPVGRSNGLRAHDEFQAAAGYRNACQIVLVLLAPAHGGNDGILGELQFRGADTLIQRVHIILVRLACHHEVQVGIGRDVHGDEGVDGGFACECFP